MSSRQITIGSKTIGDTTPAFVIAEVGHNHQGDLELCKQIFRSAAQSGADAVKLQKRSNRDQFTNDAYNAVYNSEASFGKTYGEHREYLEFGSDEYLELKELANELGLVFFSTAFDIPSLEFLVEHEMPALKIASGDIVNTPLLARAAQTGIPIIASTGAASMEEIDRAQNILKNGRSEYAFLQCTSGYPALHEELNIRVVESYRERYPDTVVGFSSHENGTAMPLIAFTLGARIIEKHFTIDRTLKGTDQAFSLSPSGMSRMCRELKRAHLALGDGVKRVYASEHGPMKKQRKSIVAAHDLKAGSVVSAEDLAFKVPNEGLLPYQADLIMGKKSKRDIAKDTYLFESDFD